MKSIKAINFDLSTKQLQTHYPGLSWRNGYRDVGKKLHDNGFERRQCSGYNSTNELTDTQVIWRIRKITRELPWLQDCVKVFDVTNVTGQANTFDMLPTIKSVKLKEKSLKRSQASQEIKKTICRELER